MNIPTKPKDNVVKWLRIIISILVIAGIGTMIYALSEESTPTPSSIPKSSSEESQPMLVCLSWSNYREYNYIHVVGEVKNISDTRLEHVVAVVTCRMDDGTLVKSDDALIEYDPLMPGQTSPFTVLIRDNPAITRLGLKFKLMFGGELLTQFR